MVKVAPSLLSADFSQLGLEVKRVCDAGADWLHVDVMDGHFVPNITMGPFIVEAIKKHSTVPLDVHLMIDDPDKYIKDFAAAGADIITIHAENNNHIHRSLQLIKSQGVKAGLSYNPATPIDSAKYLLDELDLILLMSVNPGFGGQDFIHSVLEKIREVSNLVAGKNIEVQVDGGINQNTASQVIDAGATVLVSGSYIFSSNNVAKAIKMLNTEKSIV